MKIKTIQLIVFTIFLVVACQQPTNKDYIKLSGKVNNKTFDTLLIYGDNFKTPIKTIILNEDGTFLDTLHAKTRAYTLYDGSRLFSAYLKKGKDLEINYDQENFDETLDFLGDTQEENKYLKLSGDFYSEKIQPMEESLYDLKNESFVTTLDSLHKIQKDFLYSFKNLDSSFTANQLAGIKETQLFVKNRYDTKQSILNMNGKESPNFTDYINYNGEKSSLKDYLGSYVYIDMWATWCVPCKKEIPFLKEIEKKYHDKNIKFISISTDKKTDFYKWKTMVEDNQMTGIQLFANGDESFSKQYKVWYIPRFILIDKTGKIINSEAPRPSEKELVKLLDSILT